MAYLVFSLLFLLPLFIFPVGSFIFEPPKVILAEGLIELLLILILFNKNFSLKKYNFQLLFILGLIFIISIIHLIVFNTSTMLFGNVFRLQGVFLLWHLLIWAVISSTFKLNPIPAWLYLIPVAGLFVSTLLLGGELNGRAFGTLGEPNALAATVLFIWPFTAYKFIKYHNNKLRLMGILILLLSGLIIFLSGSRSALIALFIQSVFLLSILSKRMSLTFSTTLSGVLILISLILPVLEKNLVYENRGEIWATALIAGFVQPVLGYGFGNIDNTIKNTGITLRNNIQYQFIDSSHNLFLDWLLQTGLIGVILLTLLLWETIKSFVKQRKTLELTSLIGLLTVMLFNPVSVVNLVAFWWLIGQGFGKILKD